MISMYFACVSIITFKLFQWHLASYFQVDLTASFLEFTSFNAERLLQSVVIGVVLYPMMFLILERHMPLPSIVASHYPTIRNSLAYSEIIEKPNSLNGSMKPCFIYELTKQC